MGQRDETDKMKSRKEKLADYFYDLSKLTFGAMVIGGMSLVFTEGFKSSYVPMVLVGVATTYITAYLANRILKY